MTLLRCFLLFAGCFLPSICLAQGTMPATAKDAARVLDLSAFPKFNVVGKPNTEVIANQSYVANGECIDIAHKIRDSLLAQGFMEHEHASYTDAYSSATFSKQGFQIVLMVFPNGAANQVSVNLKNQGNVDLSKIPIPPSLKPLYALPNVAAYTSELSVEQTKEACKQVLSNEGWKPFGETTVSFFMKKNAILIQLMVGEAPAQNNKTNVQISAEQMSVDFPVPPQIVWLQYADATCSMHFQSNASRETLIRFFEETLGAAKWQATTDRPIKIGIYDELLLRNDEKALIEIKFQEVDSKQECVVSYQSPEQVKAIDASVQAKLAEKARQSAAMTEKKLNPSTVQLSKISGAKVGEQTKQRIELTVPSGTAKKAIESWLEVQKNAGWKIEKNFYSDVAGDCELRKDAATIQIDFVDPGLIPAEITIDIDDEHQIEFVK